jgi:hypothetical protein
VAEDRVAASGLRRPRCVWCGRPLSHPRSTSCREHYDLEQALRLYYNVRRHGHCLGLRPGRRVCLPVV